MRGIILLLTEMVGKSEDTFMKNYFEKLVRENFRFGRM